MCPACVAGAAWIIGSVVTTGGIGALGAKMFRSKRNSKVHATESPKQRRKGDGYSDKQEGNLESGAAS
jgi:hypothetical protein